MTNCLEGIISVPVYYEDTDALGYVYHADLIDIESRLEFSRSPRMLCTQKARRDSLLLVEAHIELAMVNASGKPQRLTPPLIAFLRS